MTKEEKKGEEIGEETKTVKGENKKTKRKESENKGGELKGGAGSSPLVP